jgi:hypothetical protein
LQRIGIPEGFFIPPLKKSMALKIIGMAPVRVLSKEDSSENFGKFSHKNKQDLFI